MKTISLKKVAVVAVASLGFGLLSVVPANAAVTTARTVFVDATVGDSGTTYTSATGTLNGSVGIEVTKKVALTTATAADSAEVISITPVLTSAPAGSTVTVGAAGAGKVGMKTPVDATGNGIVTSAADSKWTNAVTAGGVNTLTFNATTGPVIAARNTALLSLTADVAGTYVVTLNPSSTTGTGTNTSAVVTFYIANLYASTADGLTSGTQSSLTASGVAGPNNRVTLTFRTTASESRVLSVSGAGSTLVSVGAPTAGTSVVATDKLSALITDDGTAEDVSVVIATPTVGTITASVFAPVQGGIYSTTAYGTVTITVRAAAIAGGVDAATSTSVNKAGATWAAGSSSTTDDTVLASRTASATPISAIKVSLGRVSGAITTTTAVTASISGPGVLYLNDNNDHSTSAVSTGRSVASTIGGINAETFYVLVAPDGNSGVGTVTISVGGYTSTETVTFFGAPSKFIATTNIVAGATGVASTDAVTVCALDSAGIAATGATIYAFSGDTTVATVEPSGTTSTSATTAAGTSYTDHRPVAAAGCYSFDVTGASQTTNSDVVLTFGDAATIATSTVTATAKLLLGSVAATTVALTTDKASYKPGEAVVLTLAFRDSVGRPVAYGPGTDTLAAALTSSVSLGSSALFGTANISKTGTTVQTVYAPLTAGPVTISGTTGADTTYLVTAARGGALSATFTVAQNADIAGIAASISALNAKIVALNALIAKIMKRLNIR